MNPYAAKIYIDGSCYNNPGGKGGFAGILEMPEDENDPVVIFQIGYENTTNNRMEMRALITALEYVKKNASELRTNGINEVEIFSDSNTTIICYDSAETWRSNEWLGVHDNPIKNVDLLKEIITLKNSINFRCRPYWVLNKSSDVTNRVDDLAKEASSKAILKNDSGYIKPKISKTAVKGRTEAFNAQGQQIIVRIFEHGPVSRRKASLFKVKFEIQAEDTREKYYAFTSQEINSKLDRWHYYDVKFNNNPQNPRMESIQEVTEDEFLAQCE